MGAPSPSPDVERDVEGMPIGSILDGRYRIDAVLGTGGMGRVYKGEHTSLGRTVAIKVLHADLGRNREAAARFQREALASGRLDHPNIVGVSDFGVVEGALYLVMEALEGESVGDRLEREKRIPWRDSVQIIRAVLAGLRHAHDRGVVHRDIKPDNIFLARKDGEQIIKILDFGIAKLYAGDPADPASTRAGLTVGTPAYLSPEQAVGGAITPASDIYSTSIVLYEMLTGRPPYDDKDPMAMLTAHVTREPPTFADVAPDLQLPAALERVVRMGLAKVAKERIGSAQAYIQMLDEAMQEAQHAAPIARASGAMVIATPPPGTLVAPDVRVTDPQVSGVMPVARRAMTLAESAEPIPRKWIVMAAGVLGGALVLALVLLVRGHGGSSGGFGDREAQLKALLHELDAGKTCADRRDAIPKLVELGDARAIPELRRARYRMRGGVLGIGDSNTNACLKNDADEAIKALSK